MAVVNGLLDPSEQKKPVHFAIGPFATGATSIVTAVPYPCVLDAVQLYAFGLSGAPSAALVANRFIPGTGFTAITVAVGTSNLLVAYGTSGVGASGMNLGGVTVVLQANDVLEILLGGTSSAVTGLAGIAVLQPIQDVKTFMVNLA